MEGGEKIHYLTEAIYKNLIDNFNPGIKQLISTGRVYQKSVLNMTSAAKSYIDCMYSLAQNGQVCKGATSELGSALLQLAEVCRQINTQVVDSIKLFHSELLMPLETKHETEYKQIQTVYKKYVAGHKYNAVPYEKAQTTLKKHKKKTKSRYGFDQKEMQYVRQVRECRVNLNEYHLQGLRQALLDERQCYCFLLDRSCVIMQDYAERLSKMHHVVSKQMLECRSLCEDSSTLPESSEAVVQAFRNQDGMYCGMDEIQDLRHRRTSGRDFEHETCDQTNCDVITGRHSSTCAESGSATCSSTPSTCSEPNQSDVQHKSTCQRQASSHVQAMYSYTSADEIQLNFVEGDIIAVLGERKDGWQYGENIHTKSVGWFPISFTQSISERRPDKVQHRATHPLSSSLRHRVKSLGNLYDIGAPNAPNYQFTVDTTTGQLQRSHTVTERPMSMYVDSSQLYSVQTAPCGNTKHTPSGSVPDVNHHHVQDRLEIVPPPPLEDMGLPSPPPPSALLPCASPPNHSVHKTTTARPPCSACDYTDQRSGVYTTHSQLVYNPAPVYIPTASPGASSSGYSSNASRHNYPVYNNSGGGGGVSRLPPLPPPNLAPPLPPPNFAPPPPNYSYTKDMQSSQVLTSVW